MIKFVFRWAFRLLVLAIVLVVGLLLLKDTIARSTLEKRIRSRTGFEVKMGRVELALLRPVFSVDHLKLYNPPEFGGGLFADIPDLHLEYVPRDVPFKGIRLKLLRLDLRELNIVQNGAGRTNLVDFMSRAASEVEKGATAKSNSDNLLNGVDLLNLSIGSVSYTDLKNPKRNQKIQVGMSNEIVKNVRSEQDIAAILFRAFLKAGITIYVDEPAVHDQPHRSRFETGVKLKKN